MVKNNRAMEPTGRPLLLQIRKRVLMVTGSRLRRWIRDSGSLRSTVRVDFLLRPLGHRQRSALCVFSTEYNFSED